MVIGKIEQGKIFQKYLDKKLNFLLNKNGFNALIISPINQNKMYRVAVDVYEELDIEKKNLKSYKEKLNNELWILKH